MTSTSGRKRTEGVRLWAVLFWLAVWQAGSMAFGQQLLLPSPVSALLRLLELGRTAAFWRAVSWSAVRIFGGFFLSCAAAAILAALAARLRFVEELLYPLAATVKAAPVASFIILALVWLSPGSLSMFIAFLMGFPTVYLNLLEGIRRTEPRLLEMARVFRVPGLRRVRSIYIPQVLPWFRSACSLALGLCWKAGIAAEIIGLPVGSVGERLYTAKVYFETPDLFAWTAAVITVSVVCERLFLTALDRLLRREGAL